MASISVLMSLYEKESPKFLRECLTSILQQTRLPEEVVIVFDGSIPEELTRIVGSFKEELNIREVHLATNSGLAIALNAGLDVCTGELVARIDTDDYCFPERLQVQEDFLENNPCVSVVGSFAELVDFEGNHNGIRTNPVTNEDIYKDLWCCPLIHPSVMYRKDVIEKLGNYNASLKRRQDYELWFRAARENVIFHNINQPLIGYRFHSDTNKRQSPKLALTQGVIGFKGSMALKLGLLKSILCFYPFFRSFLPSSLQHKLYFLLKKVDPRR